MNKLTKISDYSNWDKLIEDCQFIDDLSKLEKEKAKLSFEFLKKELGEQFLVEAFKKKHPFCSYLTNRAPWTRKWIISFANSIKEIKKSSNYDSLLKRIKHKLNYHEAVSVLQIANKFSKMDFDITFDPEIKVTKKKPDLKLVNPLDSETLFAEITILKSSKKEQDNFKTFNAITDTIMFKYFHLVYCGRIYKVLSEQSLSDTIKKVVNTFETAEKEKEFQELSIKDIIDIGVSPSSQTKLLKAWAEEKGFKVGEFSGPSYSVDEIERIKFKIENKQKQVPTENANILVIYISNVSLFFKDPKSVINKLEEKVYKYPHLLCVAIMGEHIGFDENTIISKDQHFYIRKAKDQCLVNHSIVLINKYCQHKLSPNVTTRIFDAFRRY